MRKILIFIFISFSLNVNISIAQKAELIMENVTVLNDSGHVQINWKYDGTDDIKIYRDIIDGGVYTTFPIIENLTASTSSFIDSFALAHTKPRAYRVQEHNSVIFPDLVSTYYLTFTYDSCLQQANLYWTDLKHSNYFYKRVPSKFFINIIENGTPLSKISLPGTENEFTYNGLIDNTNYKIFIETEWSKSGVILESTSNSNPISLFTNMTVSPAYINPVSTIVEGNNTNIKFSIDPNTELDTYKLLKSDSENGDFDTLETYITTEYEFETYDKNSNPDSDISYYKLISLNQCGYETTASGLINNIVLEAEIEDFDVSLTWNKLNENMNPIEYEIYIVKDNLVPERVDVVYNDTSYKYNIEDLQDYGQFCYFIRAIESGPSPSDYSQSNVSCVYLKPKVYIAEAFTPNDDGLNDEFKVIISFVPKEFDLKVYNRWGNKVYESGDYSEAWNGKLSNGSSAPTGSYIYYLRIKSPNDQIIEQKGSIMVIHP